LLMERLSCELGAVRRSDLYQLGLSGGTDSIQLLKLEYPRPGAWTNPATAAPFRLVSYSLQGEGGLVRSEIPLWVGAVYASTNEAIPTAPTTSVVTDDVTPDAAASTPAATRLQGGTSAMPARSAGTSRGTRGAKGSSTPGTSATRGTVSSGKVGGLTSSPKAAAPPKGAALPDDTMEPMVTTDTTLTTNTTSRTNAVAASATSRGALAIGQAQFVRFRYWDGNSWLDGWDTPDLPVGVEVSLGLEPLPAEMTADEYPFELYRRVIYLPNHGPAHTAAAASMEGL
jgi:hypothetical protein